MSPVRNIGGLRRPKPIPVYLWIPPKYNPIFKIEIYDGTNTTDITSYIISGEYIDGVTETIGNFLFKIDNSIEQFTSSFSLYNQIRIYLDYGSSATTLRFVGMIERISKSDSNLILSGRSSAAKVIDTNVTYSATETRSGILASIINKYFSGVITTTNIETDSEEITVNYYEKPFWEVVEDICNRGNWDAYIDKDFDFHYFEGGTRENTTEAIVHGYNLINTGDFSPDISNVFNRIRVYGERTDGIPSIATADDLPSQTLYGIKVLKIEDSSINSTVQAQARADYELSINKDPPTVGNVISLGLPTIAPGEMIRISDPMNGLNPSTYKAHKFMHKFSNDDPFMTEITIQKERSSIPNILKKRIKYEPDSTENINPNEMEFSYIWDFDTDIGTHTDTEITGGVLKTDGSASGEWISQLVQISSSVTAVQITAFGNNVSGSSGIKVWFSGDNGTTFTQVGGPGTKTATVSSGTDLKLKVEINSATTQINTLGLLYKLT